MLPSAVKRPKTESVLNTYCKRTRCRLYVSEIATKALSSGLFAAIITYIVSLERDAALERNLSAQPQYGSGGQLYHADNCRHG